MPTKKRKPKGTYGRVDHSKARRIGITLAGTVDPRKRSPHLVIDADVDSSGKEIDLAESEGGTSGERDGGRDSDGGYDGLERDHDDE